MFTAETKIFNDIVEKITRQEVLDIINERLSKNSSEVFPDQIFSNDENSISHIQGSVGLYFFEIKRISAEADWESLYRSWNRVEKSSPAIRSRWNSHFYNDNDFFPFYIGKSLDSLKSRVSQHIFSQTKVGYLKSTLALRLKEHYSHPDIKNIMKCFLFRVSSCEINIHPDLIYLIESRIRRQKNCMIGRDRA